MKLSSFFFLGESRLTFTKVRLLWVYFMSDILTNKKKSLVILTSRRIDKLLQ